VTRKPLARDKIIHAARRIVEARGAAHLTFDELSVESGVTRGGITYHFPTKDALLQGLLEHDMAQWKLSESQLAPSDVACPQLCDLVGFIRSHTSQDESRRRFVAGMLSAAVHQPELLDSCREEARQRFGHLEWDDSELRAQVLRQAAVGLFWDELFGFQLMPPEARARFVALLERLAEEWSVPADPAAAESMDSHPTASESSASNSTASNSTDPNSTD
jgi:AcrR family transcriptional regulator